MHSAIYETSLVLWYSIDLWLTGGGTCARGICALCYMFKLFSVVVFHICMVNWGVYLPWLDVHSGICETDVV